MQQITFNHRLTLPAAASQVDVDAGQLVKVIIADGTYEMTSRINVPTGVSVAGESQENTILKISSDYTSVQMMDQALLVLSV